MKNKFVQSMLVLVITLGFSSSLWASQKYDDYDDVHIDYDFDDYFDDYKDDYNHRKFIKEKFSAKLDGYQEVPAVITDGKGRFKAKAYGYTVKYSLSYIGLSGDALAAHIHLGQPGVNGGLLVWLCDATEANAPACPEPGETVVGTISADDVQAIASQGVEAGDFEALIRAMLNGVTYINVHTENFPGGEIRGYVDD